MRAALLALLALLAACPKGSVPPAEPAPRLLTILATNDFHGRFRETIDDATGLARGGVGPLADAIDEVRRERGADRVLLVDAGDQFQGTPLVNETRGIAAVELFSLLGYDAVAVGNHEFDYGGDPDLREALKAAAARASYPMLTANTRHEDGRLFTAPNLVPSVLIERGGVRVGLLGLTPGDTVRSTHPKNVVGLRFEDVATAAAREAAALRARGAEVVVALAHVSGHCTGPRPADSFERPEACDLDEGSELRALTELPEGTLDVIVAGHENQLIAHRYGRTAVLGQRAHGWMLGRVDLVVGRDGVDWEASTIHAPRALVHPPLEPACGADPDEKEAAPEPAPAAPSELHIAARRWLADAETRTGLSRCALEGCLAGPAAASHRRQSPAGTLVAEAMLGAMEADVALQNSGGLRSSLGEGPVFREDLYGLLPFENTVVRLELSGARLRELLRIGTAGGVGVQVAGLRYGYDPDDSLEDRLCWVEVGGEPLDEHRTYRVLMNDYMAAGGMPLPGLPDLPREEGPRLRDVLRAALHAAGPACLDPAQPPPASTAVLEDCR